MGLHEGLPSDDELNVLRSGTSDDLIGDILTLMIGVFTPSDEGLIERELLAAAERDSKAPEAELFTGSLSEANVRLYESCGYRITERVDQGDGTEQLFMRKRLGAELRPYTPEGVAGQPDRRRRRRSLT